MLVKVQGWGSRVKGTHASCVTPDWSLTLSEPVSNLKTATTSKVITGYMGANTGPSLEEMTR